MIVLTESRVGRFSLFLVGIALTVVVLLASFIYGSHEPTSVSGWFALLMFFDRALVDFFAFLLLCVFLINGRVLSRCLAYALLALFMLGYATQLYSIFIGREFLTFLAIDNVNHISLLVNYKTLGASLLLVLLFAGVIGFVEKQNPIKLSMFQLSLVALILLGCVLGFRNSDSWLPNKVNELRAQYYASKNNRLPQKSPLEQLYKALFRGNKEVTRALTEQDIARAEEYGISLATNQRYPLIKEQIYKTEAPFFNSRVDGKTPNVILFFVEGLSARLVNSYSDYKPGLTPNLLDFSKQAITIDNYYNHTYATYRGLHGQLCSLYPIHGGHGGWDTHYQRVKNVSYFCLTDLFNSAGYQSIFIDTHRKDFGFIDEMMSQLNFSEVLTAEDIERNYVHESPIRRDSLSDDQLMRGLIGRLRELENTKSEQPFFLSLYNLETHAFQPMGDHAQRYPLEKNYILDTVHNFDFAWGKFWQYFKSSTLFENTAVVVTSDHAHYPDRDFLGLMEGDETYQPYFVDRIPLMIYDPNRAATSSNKRFDAQYSNSIDFAPSMAHWFGLQNSINAFTGRSIFEKQNDQNKSIASADSEHYIIDADGVEMVHPDNYSEELSFAAFLIESLRSLERHDRIWDKRE